MADVPSEAPERECTHNLILIGITEEIEFIKDMST